MRNVLIGLVTAVSLSCYNGDITGSSTTRGTYTLRTIADSNLPYMLPGTGIEILDDTMILYEGFTYSQTIHTRSMVNGQPVTTTTVKNGPYGINQGALAFSINSSTVVRTGTINGNKMIFVEGGLTYVYSK